MQKMLQHQKATTEQKKDYPRCLKNIVIRKLKQSKGYKMRFLFEK